MNELVGVLQREWLHRNTFDWPAFEEAVLERVKTARTVVELHDAIRVALTLLKDQHSYYVSSAGETIFNPYGLGSETPIGCEPRARAWHF